MKKAIEKATEKGTGRAVENAKGIILKYTMILAGLAIASFGVVAFILPNDIIIGSSTGMGRVMYHFFAVPVSYTVAIVNGLLFLLGLVALGKEFALSTLISSFAYPLFMGLFERMEFLQHITDNAVIAALYGGVFAGVGMGMVIKAGASTGGTDIVAIVINRKWGISVGLPMYLLDFVILMTQVFFAGNAEEILLGIVTTFLYSMIAEKVVTFGGGPVQIVVISARFEAIRTRLADMVVGTTILYGESGYLGERRDVLLCVLPAREVAAAQRAILELDPEAFMTINRVKEVKGRGYSFDVGRAKALRKERQPV